MEMKEFSAKTAELAIEKGLKELGITKEEAEIEIKEGKAGLLSKKVTVLIGKKENLDELAVEFLGKLLEKINIKATLELSSCDDECNIEIITVDSSEVIGKRGEIIDSFQYLVSMYVNRDKDEFRRIVLDCDNYREERENNLKELARRMAKKADDLGRKVQLDNMNAYERMIIHAELKNSDIVTTESKGVEPNRFVVIYAKNRKFVPRNNFNRDRKPGGGFNRDKKPYNSNGGGYNKDRNSGGFNRDRNNSGGFNKDRKYNNDRPSQPPRSKEVTFGTYLGNVNDEKKKDEN